jgi:dTDP-4-amino-4,6-dideoxygalactose transaminase
MIPIVRPELPPLDDFIPLLEEIWDSKMLSNFGPMAKRMEALTANYLDVKHSLVCTSGETGLMITLAALELPQGAPCFVSSFTFNSTINAPLWNNLRPVIVDIDPATFCMSASSLSAAMRRHPQPGVVLATHVFGNPCDVDALEVLTRNHGSYLIFDAAHGYGSLRGDKHVGALGDAEVFSLSGTKLVTTGEGGLITTSHDWLAERLMYFRAHGFQNDYDSKVLGLNGKFSEIHAALGLLTLPNVENAVAARHEILAKYHDALSGTATWQAVRSVDRSTYKDINIGVGPNAGAIVDELDKKGIQTKRYFRPLHTMEMFKEYGDGQTFPNAQKVYDETLCVPAYADMPDWVVGTVADVVKSLRTKRPAVSTASGR